MVIVSHFIDEPRQNLSEERLLHAQNAAIAHSAAEQLAQDIPPFHVARLRSVGNRKRKRANMVGDHMKCGAKMRVFLVVFFAAHLFDLGDQAAQDVGSK